MLKPISLTIEYDGTDFIGWQVQPGQRSVQGELERALETLHGQPLRVTASGRTDSGVHALGQVVSFVPPVERPLKAYTHGLNAMLPHDMAVKQVDVRPEGFDARRWSRGKVYRYTVFNGRVRSPLHLRTSWQVYPPLDVAAMQQAAPSLLGTHDFSAFRASDCEAKTTVRVMRRVDVAGSAGGLLTVEVEATAFLKHMVRNVVGTLVEVGMGVRTVESVGETLRSLDRKLAGRTAPAQGLCLVQVFHGDRHPADDPDA
jgi:tRNA pseudouridine38-40 synthase